MIIPAAGRGSRLQARLPKVLFPVAGKAMIDYLFELYASVVDLFIIVVHPSFEQEIRSHCENFSLTIEYELQSSPTGMLDAILMPRDRVQKYKPDSVWVTWCDQVAVSSRTVGKLLRLSDEHPETALIFPTISRKKPYIHFVRNEQNRIVDVLHLREGSNLPEIGESDLGLFCLSLQGYLDMLTTFSRTQRTGKLTNEKIFLTFIPWLNNVSEILTFSGKNEIESLGINTKDDLNLIEAYLLDE